MKWLITQLSSSSFLSPVFGQETVVPHHCLVDSGLESGQSGSQDLRMNISPSFLLCSRSSFYLSSPKVPFSKVPFKNTVQLDPIFCICNPTHCLCSSY